MIKILILLLMILAPIFWVWMLVDCATNESFEGNDKVVWVIIIAMTSVVGATLYFFVIRLPRRNNG